MLPLQNQEPVLAHPCRHLGCPKKRFWRTSTESGTCHKSSKRFSLQHQGTQSFFFGCTFMILRNTKTSTCPCAPLQALRLSKKWLDGPLQNEEPATNLARCFLYKIRAPNPIFWVHFRDFQNRWPLQSGEPDMTKHLSRIATWKKENHQTYKDPFCRGMMWKNLGLPVSPENTEMYKTIFCRATPVPHFQFL